MNPPFFLEVLTGMYYYHNKLTCKTIDSTVQPMNASNICKKKGGGRYGVNRESAVINWEVMLGGLERCNIPLPFEVSCFYTQ
jgi:hypothetical protein